MKKILFFFSLTLITLFQTANAQTINGITVMLNYSDQAFGNSKDSVSMMMNQTGFSGWGSMGSVKDFFYTQSNGNVTLTSQVVQVTLPQTAVYYHGPGDGGNHLVADIVDQINLQFPNGFQNLTAHPQGGLWHFNLLSRYPGGGYAFLYSGKFIKNNGVPFEITRGNISFYGPTGFPGINTICHESGHSVMNWTDYYRTAFCNLGDYDVMASAGTSKAPMPINPALRLQKNWISNVVNISGSANANYTLTSNSYSQIHKYTNPNNPKEYLLFHALKHGGYYQPVLDNGKVLDEGLAIWYVDEDCGFDLAGVDNQYFIRLVQADNMDEMHNEFNAIQADVRGDLNDLYDNFSSSFPNGTPFRWKDGGEFGISISNISAPGATMTFTVNARPNTVVASSDFNGTLSPKGTLGVAGGQNQTFNLIPNIGYEVDAVRVNGTQVTATNPFIMSNITGTQSLNASFRKMSIIDPLPSPWTHMDIGTPSAPGLAAAANGRFNVESYGSDISGAADNFNYAFQTLNGDGSIVARLAQTNATSWVSKVGIMLRESLNANAAYAMIARVPYSGVTVQQRTAAGNWTDVNPNQTPSLHIYSLFNWFKIARVGTQITCSCSRDGVSWTVISQQNLAINTSVYVGMFATGANGAEASKVVFDNVTVTSGNSSPTVSITAPANNTTITNPAAITITANAADANGTVAKVDFYNGNQFLGTDNTAPYSFVWTNVSSGKYAITAKATDNQGAFTTSVPVNISVPCTFTDPKITGVVIGTLGSWNNSGSTREKAFDGDVLSYFDAADDIAWTGLSLAKDCRVTGINFYPRQGWAGRMVAGKFQGSNTADFSSGVVDLAVITIEPGYEWNCVSVSNYSSFKYLRYICAAGGVGNVAEIEFHGTEVLIAPNLALNKPTYATSIENAGTLAKYATDGSASSRWSSAFADPQALVVNLGAQYAINQVKITWEAAAGKDYTIQVSADSLNWSTIKSVTGNTTLVNNFTGLSGTGKFVKVFGTARTTAYGYSIFELEVYGTAASNNVFPKASITTPVNNATFTLGNAVVIGATATDADGTISKVEFFNGTTLLGTSTTSPYQYTWIGAGVGTYSLTAKATDNLGAATTSAPVTIIVNQRVVPNLALNRPTYASSIENAGTPAKGATDGNTSSRWSSAFADPQWLVVNLGGQYTLNQVKITWEAAAGKDYVIQVSPDSVNWTTIKTVTSNASLVNNLTGLSGTGKFVKIYGTARTTVYGYSIFELEIYGTPSTAGAAAQQPSFANTESVITGTALNASQQGVIAYPNPITENQLNVVASFRSNAAVQLIVSDLMGAVLFSKDVENQTGTFENKINVESLAPGIYLLKVISGDQLFMQKIIKN